MRSAPPNPPDPTTEIYDDFTAPGGYTLEHYAAKWIHPFGLGEIEHSDTRSFDAAGFHVAAAPFQTASDVGIFDHPKYFAVSTKTFPVPVVGSVQFSCTITAETPGAVAGRIVRGRYLATGEEYAAPTLEGQQAAAVLNMIDFATGQLFDWFVASRTAFALIERLPSVVTANTDDPQSPRWVGPDKMYTQIVAEFPLTPGPHRVGVRFSRDTATGRASWFLDGEQVAVVERVGMPLDGQNGPYANTYPALGRGEEVAPRVDSVSLAHGLFSLLDAFPFQHPEVPDLAVGIPLTERRWGQGAVATFAEFRVDTRFGS